MTVTTLLLVPCEHCSRSFRLYTDLWQHVRYRHPEVIGDYPKPAKKGKANDEHRYTCASV